MYHHHSQQQGSQSFSNGPRPPHHQPPPNQHQNRTSSDMLSQALGFQFPRPTQLPDELESALAIRGARDMDHRLIDHMSQPNQHQNQSSSSGISQHGSFGSNPVTLTSDNQSAHQQGVDWSGYQPPTKLFSSPPPSAGHQAQRHQGPQQQPQSSHTGTSIQSWKTPISDSQSPQARHPLGSGDSQGMYTPESAGSILASFGLSNEDLEVLSHYPDDQLTPDTLPFILRDIQINKSGTQNIVTPASSTVFKCGNQEMPLRPSRSSPLTRSRSPEVPSLLTVTQTAGKVIDYGHASRRKDETAVRKTFKREQLSSERTVKMYPSSLPSSSAPKVEKAERRQVRLEHTEPSKHGDQDYRRTSSDHRKSTHSPRREFQPSSKPRNLDRDYRREGLKPRPSSETRSEASSRRSLSSSSSSKAHSSRKKLPTPTMISDFSAVSPKVYPHTCSLCHTQCDQEKDWVDHINTVNHTAACRDLRNKYPDWKPDPPSRSGQYGSQASRDPKDQPPSRPGSRSVSCSLSPSPPHSKHRVCPPHRRLHGRPFSPHHHPRQQHYTGDSSRSGLKRPHDDLKKFSADASRHLSYSKTGHSTKHGPSLSSTKTFKSGTKPGTKAAKTASSKAADVSAKPPPAKKKKKVVTPASQDSSIADRLVYLTGIPKDASEQEVTDLVGSFGRINNVILMPCSEEESEKGEGQKASVCMVKAEDAQALANSTNLSIREQQITTSTAKVPSGENMQKPEEEPSPDTGSSKPAQGPDKDTVAAGAEADQKSPEEKATVLITGLPESGWSESDIIKLLQPFGTPSDIILATQIGKVLVLVPDMETAQEIVKVHSFMPAKMGDAELKIIHLKQSIGLSTPVALYNLLIGSAAPLESPAPVSWSSLLVISNVPNTPSGSSEVQKLVRRFGTVIKTLVLNSMVICEMATAAMALSVYKRFQTFPCIIQNNPLFFSRKADPRANTQTKVISAYLESTEEMPANGKDSKTSAVAEEEATAGKEDFGSPEEGMEKGDIEKEEKMKSNERMVVEEEALGENGSKDDNQDELTVSDSVAAPNNKPEGDLEANMMETPVFETIMEPAEEKKDGDASTAGDAAGGESKITTSDGKAASQETSVPQLPKVTQEMVNVLLEECRTRNASNSNNTTTAPSNGGTQPETEQGDKAAAAETKEPAKNQGEEEAKRQEREQKERARKEKERKERERRAWEKEERTRKERERDERARRDRERREEEKRERERREKKRTHGEGSSGWRSSSRSEGNKQSSWRGDQNTNPEAATKMEEPEEECDEFPFNMSDFVTVDEVGDVTDLPGSPSSDVCMDTTQEEGDAPVLVQKNAPEDTPSEVTAATPVKSDEHGSEPKPVTEPTAETSDRFASSELAPGLVLTASASPPPDPQSDSSHSQTQVPTCQPEAPETETALTATPDPTAEAELLPTPAESSSNSPATGVVTAVIKEEEKEPDSLYNIQVKEEKVEEKVVSNKTEEEQKLKKEDERGTGAPAAETGKHQRSEEHKNTEQETVRKKVKTDTSTDSSLPPFDPSCPVGMEFLAPKIGFFCKVCNRFFSGAKEAEINHCKTFKHYENLQKYFQSRKMSRETTKRDCS